MNKIKEIDLKFGEEKEVGELNTLQNTFSKNLKRVNDKYFLFDFTSDTCYVELKSRRNTHNKYPDTMIGKNKIDYAEKSDKDVFFCFSFTDGLFYWKYNKTDIENGNVEFRLGGRNDRGKEEYKNYAFIKNSILIKI